MNPWDRESTRLSLEASVLFVWAPLTIAAVIELFTFRSVILAFVLVILAFAPVEFFSMRLLFQTRSEDFGSPA